MHTPLIQFILMALLMYACKTPLDNAHLSALAQSDQQDRITHNPACGANDVQRYTAVKTLITTDSLHTSNDYFNAAIVLQHGDSASDYLLANRLAHKAVSLNKHNLAAKTLIAQSQDRYLRKINQPQWYGTQRFEYKGTEYLEPIDTTVITEKERRSSGVSTLQEKLLYFNQLYHRSETSIFAYVISDSLKNALIAENPVEIAGGTESLVAQIRYPEQARQHQISGKVTVELTIDKTGSVKTAFVVSGIGYGCDEEALRVIRNGTYLNHSEEDQEIRIRIPFRYSVSE